MAARIQKNLVDDEIPSQGGSHASSSHEGVHAIGRNVHKVVEVVREDVRSFP